MSTYTNDPGTRPDRPRHLEGGREVKRKSRYDILLAGFALVFALVLAGVWLNDERLAWVGLILLAVICTVAAVLITLNDH